MKGKGLGKGLKALIPAEAQDNTSPAGANDKAKTAGIQEISLKEIRANNGQPRKTFDEEKLQELAQSIKEHGVLQPIVIKRVDQGYQVIAGERRFRASQLAGLSSIPAYIKDVDEHRTTEIALIENIQRENLNPIEEALAYKELLDQYGLTQEEMAQRLGKSRPYIANMLRLLNLPKEVQELVAAGTISNGHGRALAGIKDGEFQRIILGKVLQEALSVRQTEDLIKNLEQQAKEKKDDGDQAEKETKHGPLGEIQSQIEDKLRSHFGTGVRIKGKGKKGKIEIEYYGDEDLNRILELVLGQLDF